MQRLAVQIEVKGAFKQVGEIVVRARMMHDSHIRRVI